MAQCVRRLVLAATLAAAVALLLCTSSAPVARAVENDDFTDEQCTNTLKALQAFKSAIPELEEKWTGDDFCLWDHVACVSSSVFVFLDVSTYAGTLPEMPEDVDYRHVMIQQLDFSEMGRWLSGTLPDSWSQLQGLAFLTLSGSNVSGTLPASWHSMKSLVSLLIERCESVTGTLPPQWSSMQNAEVLQLQNCDLSGSLPPEWSSMPKLGMVSLKGNHFCGCVPDSWAQKTGLVVDIEDKHKGSKCLAGKECTTTTTTTTTTKPPPTTTTTTKPPTTTTTTTTTTKRPTTTTTEPPTVTSTTTKPPTTITTEAPAEPTTTATPTNTPTPAPETECEVDGCEVCEGDSAVGCARCREGYFLTDEKTCLVHNDGGVAAASSGVAAAAVVCVVALLSVGLAA